MAEDNEDPEEDIKWEYVEAYAAWDKVHTLLQGLRNQLLQRGETGSNVRLADLEKLKAEEQDLYEKKESKWREWVEAKR